MPGSHSYFRRDTAEVLHIGPHGISHYVDTVGKNESRIAEYVRNQLKEDELGEQLRIPSDSPFTGRK